MKLTHACLALATILVGCIAPTPGKMPADVTSVEVSTRDAEPGDDARTDVAPTDRAEAAVDAGVAPDVPTVDAPTDVTAVDVPADVPTVDAFADVAAVDVPAPRSLGGRCYYWSLCSTPMPVPPCDTGLACEGDVCVRGLPVGARCTEGGAPCELLSSCATYNGLGTCVADGKPGGRCFYNAYRSCDLGFPSDYSCSEGTVCSGRGRCEPPSSPGTPCESSATCPAGSECLLWEGARVCIGSTAVGSRCRPSTIGTPTLTCTYPLVCAPRVAEGVENRCVEGVVDSAVCVPDDLALPCRSRNCAFDGSGYRCASGPGVLGAACTLNAHCDRTPADFCNGDDRCARWVAPGGTCERRADNLLCDLDAGCVAVDATLSTGVCTGAAPEREPNAETSPQALAANTVVRGELRVSASDVDCYRVNLPRAATLLAEARQPGTLRGIDSVRLRISDATGTLVAESFGAGRNGRTAPPLARPLNAGDYTVCVRPESRDAQYVLTVSVR
jgi:hypothetical protein